MKWSFMLIVRKQLLKGYNHVARLTLMDKFHLRRWFLEGETQCQLICNGWF